MKKMLSLLMCVFILMTFMTVITPASGGITIISPSEGETAEPDMSEIVFACEAGQNAAVYLDDELIADIVTTDENTVTLDNQPLYLGEHKIKIVTYGGEVPLCSESNFTVKKEQSSVVLVEENFNGDVSLNENMTLATSGTRTVGKDSEGNSVQMTEVTPTDKEGNKNGAIGFLLDTECTLTVTEGTDYHVMQCKQDVSKKFYVEYDLLLYSTAGELELETRGESGGKVNWGYLGGSHAFKKDGIVGNGTYTPGEWMHVKHVADSENGTNSMFIDGVEVYSSTSQNTQFGGIKNIKFQYYISDGSANQGYAIDNFTVSTDQVYAGITELAYHNGNGEYVGSSGVISKDAKGLKLTFLPKLANDKKVFEKVKLFVNGNEKKPASIEIKDGDLLIELSESLQAQSEVKIVYTGDDFAAQKKTETDYNVIGVRNITYTVGGNKLYSSKQIKKDDAINVFAQIKNLTSDTKDLLIVAVLYEGDSAAAISVKRATLSGAAMTTASKHSFDITATNDGQRIELYIANMQDNASPMSRIWKLD